jgi:hypothetical protein
MAKKEKAAEGKKAKADKEAAAEAPKFGVGHLADLLGLEPASVRVQLRNKKVPKAGKSYGWNTKAELQEVADQLKAAGKSEGKGKKAKGGDAAAEKPAKGKKGKKSKK